jgi:hypothetical protein
MNPTPAKHPYINHHPVSYPPGNPPPAQRREPLNPKHHSASTQFRVTRNPGMRVVQDHGLSSEATHCASRVDPGSDRLSQTWFPLLSMSESYFGVYVSFPWSKSPISPIVAYSPHSTSPTPPILTNQPTYLHTMSSIPPLPTASYT